MENQDMVIDVDLTKRTEKEWESIYHVKIVDDIIDLSTMNEFEWAFKLYHAKYYLKPANHNSYEVAEQMEMRAMKINRDIYATADKIEKKILDDNKYMATKYILNYR